jgi:hypothetical protein
VDAAPSVVWADQADGTALIEGTVPVAHAESAGWTMRVATTGHDPVVATGVGPTLSVVVPSGPAAKDWTVALVGPDGRALPLVTGSGRRVPVRRRSR